MTNEQEHCAECERYGLNYTKDEDGMEYERCWLCKYNWTDKEKEK